MLFKKVIFYRHYGAMILVFVIPRSSKEIFYLKGSAENALAVTATVVKFDKHILMGIRLGLCTNGRQNFPWAYESFFAVAVNYSMIIAIENE